MISLTEPTGRRPIAPIYQMRVALAGIKPPIWRLLQVPGTARLGWLHAVLQVAVGWTNSHLHQFRVNETLYSDTRSHYAEFEDDPVIHDEWKATLLQVAPHPADVLGYEYDFGDSWNHDITVERILPPDPALAAQATCVDGARACPPEDCGGIWGYADLVKILRNRKHPEHKSMKDWLGGPFDPEAFDRNKTNTWLRKLKWPRVSEAQLRKVLMGRDGYRG
jgi:hypothetical protein